MRRSDALFYTGDPEALELRAVCEPTVERHQRSTDRQPRPLERRGELKRIRLVHGVDPQEAIRLLKQGMSQIPNVAADPKPECDILTFSASGPVLTVRPHTNNRTYWQVYFDTNAMIAQVFAKAGYPIPAERPHFSNISTQQETT